MNSKPIIAAIAIASGVGTYAVTRPTEFLVTSTDGGTGCVIPDCRSWIVLSGWDEQHAPVDCLAGGPYAMGGPPRWRGCSVMAAEYAVGSECLPARCSVTAGDDPLAAAVLGGL